MTKTSELFCKYLGPLISLKNGSVLKTDLYTSGFKWDWPQPWELFIFGKIKQKARCKLLKWLKKIAPWFLPNFSRNRKPPWLRSVSFETWYPKIRFEYWTIFEGYFRPEIFENQLAKWPSSVIISSYLPHANDKKKFSYSCFCF